MKNCAVILVCLCLSACGLHPRGDLYYLPRSDYGRELPPPPAPDSAEWKRDIEKIIAVQKNAKAKDIRAANFERDLRPEITAVALGKNFTPEHYPLTYRLLDRAELDCRSVVEEAKVYWQTSRPYQEDKRVKSLVVSHSNGAYPSGHTACSRVAANILTELYPARRAALNQRAFDIAQHRVLAGMHYPHDLRGGSILAAWIYHDMQEDPHFQIDLNAARSEVKND